MSSNSSSHVRSDEDNVVNIRDMLSPEIIEKEDPVEIPNPQYDDDDFEEVVIHHKPWYKGASEVKLLIMMVLTMSYMIAELVIGFTSGSLALIGDGFHMASDAISLVIAFVAIQMSKKSSTANSTYGSQRAEVIGSFVNGVFLLSVCLFIFLEAIQRFVEISEVQNPLLVIYVACGGIGINIIGLAIFAGGHGHSHGGDGGGHGHDHGGEDHGENSEHSHKQKKKHSHGHKEDNSHDEEDSHKDHKKHSHKHKKHSHEHEEDKDHKTRSHKHKKHSQGHKEEDSSHKEQEDSHKEDESSHEEDSHKEEDSSHHEEHKKHSHKHKKHSHMEEEDSHDHKKHSHMEEEDSHDHKKHSHMEEDSHDHKKHSHEYKEKDQEMEEMTEEFSQQEPVKLKHRDDNMRAVFLHILGDFLGSVAAIVSGVLIYFLKFHERYYFDPIISLIIVGLILKSSIPLVIRTMRVLMQKVPNFINVDKLREELAKVPGVITVHELHVWTLVGNKFIGTVHITCLNNTDFMRIATRLKHIFHKFNVHSTTIQPEFLNTTELQKKREGCKLGCVKKDSCKTDSCCPPTYEEALKDEELQSLLQTTTRKRLLQKRFSLSD